jgi:DNA-binding beta-propeller fold protein YncE
VKLDRREWLAALAGVTALRAAGGAISNLTAPGTVNNPYGLRLGPDGALYICETGNHRISRLDLKTRVLTTVVANRKQPYELQFDREGNLLFVDMPAHTVYGFDIRRGTLKTVAGTGEPGFGGDGGPGVQAQLRNPHSIALQKDGRRLLICDIGNHRIREVNLASGMISTYAGTGERKPTPEGAPVRGTPLNGPRAIDFDRDGNLVLVLREGNAVYRIEDGRYRHVAGTGEQGYTGDGGDARRAKLSGPKGVACAPDGGIYIADTESHTIRRIGREGTITTVAGTGERGDGPEGDPLRCKLARPHGVYVQGGAVYIGDSEAHVVRVLR